MSEYTTGISELRLASMSSVFLLTFPPKACPIKGDSSVSLLSTDSSMMGECGRAFPVAAGFFIECKTCLDWSYATASVGACFVVFLDSLRDEVEGAGDFSKCTLRFTLGLLKNETTLNRVRHTMWSQMGMCF